MADLVIRKLGKTYFDLYAGRHVTAVTDVSLEIHTGEFQANRPHPQDRIEHDREKDCVDDDEGHGGQPEAEPDEEDGQPRNVSHRLEEDDQRPEEPLAKRAQPHQQAEGDADPGAHSRPHSQPDDAVAQILWQDPLVDQIAE